MNDDITAIEAWAAGFKDVGHLTKEVAKNWLLHGTKVKADIALEESDWSADKYFDAGKDAAAAIELLVPFSKSEEDDLELDIKSVPEFAAGFLYGMVGDNHLAEFQTCMTSSDQLMPYAEAFLTDLESFKIIAAFENFEKFLFHFQEDVAPCKNVSDDVAAIEQWAAIFKEPTTLVETLAKHWLIHQKAIKKDIASEKADWSTKNYFKAGADIADAVTLAVGPIEKDVAVELEMNLKGDGEFVAGLIYGFIGDNHLSEIEACYTGSEPIIKGIEAVLGDIEHLHFIKAIESFEKIVFNFQEDTAACHNISDDLTSIKSWAGQFKHIPTLVETVAKHYLVHQRAIKKDIQAEKADWASGNFFKAGADIADAVTLALGPMDVTPPTPSTEYLTEFEKNGILHEVTHILAGFIYGMTQENHLTELEACYTGGTDLEHEVLKSISDFKHGGWDHITQGALQLAIVALQLPEELHTCEGMGDDLTEIETWAKGFTHVSTLVPELTKHFLIHKKAIFADIGTLKTDMAAEEYFQVGVEAADIATILLPIA